MKSFDKITARQPATESTAEPAAEPTKHKKSKFKVQREFILKIIANKKDISN